ncbi:OmpA family protein [uncultured Bacteroides sp.]|uniref:OmpA family protein n=1 Tax=uncultured Bacteroides sp. TaxID=162156 RepID=UPI002AA8D4EF|nr:OmpA family protein [uncultured Bacteroides sp.]
MKKVKLLALFLSASLIFGSCGTSNTFRGGAIGAGSGAALGAIIGGIAGKGKGALIGAAVGTAVGGTAGALIGRKMDKNAAAAAQIQGANVEKITDANGLSAVKVTFESGILFGFNSSTLNASSKQSLNDFAGILKADPTLDIAITGHTDKVGTYEANQTVSTKRAQAVSSYLQLCGVSNSQFKSVQGMGYSQYDETMSAEQNRRVEIYMYASEQMIKNAEAGK